MAGETTVDTVLTRFIVEGDQAVQQTQRYADEQAALTAEVEKLKAQLLELQKRLDEAPKHHEKHTSAIRELKGEMAGSMRTANFFARSLNDIMPATSLAGEGVRMLVSGLTGGLGLGLALEVVMVGAKFLGEHLKETSKEAEAFAKQSTKALDDLDRRLDEIRKKHMTPAEQAQWEAGLLRMQLEARKDVTEELEAEIDAKKSLLAADENNAAAVGAEIRESEEHIEKLKAENEQLQFRLDKLNQIAKAEVQGADAENKKKVDEKAHKDAEEAAKKAAADMKRFDEQQDAMQKAAWARTKERQEEEGAKEAERIIKQREEIAAIEHRFDVLREAGGNEEKAKAIEALDEKYRQELLVVAEREDLKTRLTAEWTKRRLDLLAKETKAEKEFYAVTRQGMQTFAHDAGTALAQVTTRSRAYEHAMAAAGDTTARSADLSAAAFAAFAQNALSSVAAEAATRAIFETGMGLAALARSFWDPTAGKEAGLHFASAAQFGAVAGVAGAAAYGIGQTRGMTRAERDSVSAYEKNQASAAGGAGGSLATAEGSSRFSGAVAESPVRERTILVIGDPFETPAETARRVARRMDLVEQLDLRRRD